MDDYGYEQFMNEYPLFPPPDNEDNSPATIDPAMLQIPVSDFNYHFEQQQEPVWDDQSWLVQLFGNDLGPSAQRRETQPVATSEGQPSSTPAHFCPFPACGHAFYSQGALHDHTSSSHVAQHRVVSLKSPFMCHCGQHFTRLGSLERHVQNNTKQLDSDLYPCAGCTAYQGKNGFKRQDHLVQHLRVFHKWDDDQLATLFLPRQTHKFKVPVCHFPECDYYRGPDFKDMGIREQEKNRPFDKQSHYTEHMKLEHDWSPYPCKVTGCKKVNGTGFFSTTTLEKHYKDKHPGSAIPATKVQGRITETIRCKFTTMYYETAKGKSYVAFAMDAWSPVIYGSIEDGLVAREEDSASDV
ncbi:hypothetical protein F4782DRAFT_525057 [Xylaria castorea]|nr:hypothetical protein F4782DRAFT_525057 [Xylaria castorea]